MTPTTEDLMTENLAALDRAADALVNLSADLQIEVLGTLLGRMARRCEHEHYTPKSYAVLVWARASEIVTGVPAHAEH